jgi:hypothetical protein
MLRKCLAAALALVLAVGSIFAEEIKGVFVKSDDTSITIKEGDKEKTYKIDGGKVLKIKTKDGEKEVKLSEVAKRYKADQKVTLTVEKELVVGIKGEGKKKKEEPKKESN